MRQNLLNGLRACVFSLKGHRYSIRPVGISLAIVLCVLPYARPVQADSNETSSLRHQVAQLQRLVESLQQEVKQIDARLQHLSMKPGPRQTAAIPAKGANSPGTIAVEQDTASMANRTVTPSTIRKGWGNIKRNMSEREVNALLGKPSRHFDLNGNPVWYYDYEGVGVGSVIFSSNRQVIGWQGPPSHWLW